MQEKDDNECLQQCQPSSLNIKISLEYAFIFSPENAAICSTLELT